MLQCLKMTTKRSLFVRLVPCRCLRGEEETVTSLDYSHCSLEQVPKEIFTFEKTLEELYLDANQIEELPKVCQCCLPRVLLFCFMYDLPNVIIILPICVHVLLSFILWCNLILTCVTVHIFKK